MKTSEGLQILFATPLPEMRRSLITIESIMRGCLSLAMVAIQLSALSAFAADDPIPAPAPRARWSEDWSSMRDFAPLTEEEPDLDSAPLWFKYIPFGDSGETFLSFGLEYRFAYESYWDADMGISSIGRQDAPQNRMAIHTDFHLNKEWRVFSELGAGFTTDREGGKKTADETDPDVWQLFLDYRWHLEDGSRWVIRGGRQLIETANLFINAGEGNNVRQTYNAVRIAHVDKEFSVSGEIAIGGTRVRRGFVPFEVFAAEYVDFEDDAFEMSGTGEYFWGVRWGRPVLDLDATLNFLYLGWDLEDRQFEQGGGGRHDELRHSIVVWFNQQLGIGDRWGFDYYLAYQFGEYDEPGGNSDIHAFAAFGEVKYALSTDARTFVLGLKTDYFSGDDDPDDGELRTFYNPVFATPYFGYARDIQPFNLIHVQPNIAYRFGEKSVVTLSHGFNWRSSTKDAYYGKPNGITAGADTSSSHWMGQQTQLSVRYLVNRNILLSGYLGYFFAGDVVKDAGGKDRAYFDIGIHFLY